MEYLQYVKPELFILIPVMYLIGTGLKKSALKDKFIPLVLGAIAVVLCAFYLLATADLGTLKEYAMAIFIAITQGVLIAGASVYADQIIKQSKKEE